MNGGSTNDILSRSMSEEMRPRANSVPNRAFNWAWVFLTEVYSEASSLVALTRGNRYLQPVISGA